MNCDTRSIFIAPLLVNRFTLYHKAAHVTTVTMRVRSSHPGGWVTSSRLHSNIEITERMCWISNIWNSSEGIIKPLWHTGRTPWRSKTFADSPKSPCSYTMCSRMLQLWSQLHLKAPACMEVNDRWNNIWLTGESDYWATETFKDVCGRRWGQLRFLHSSAGYFTQCAAFSIQWFVRFHNHKPYALAYSSWWQSHNNSTTSSRGMYHQSKSIWLPTVL